MSRDFNKLVTDASTHAVAEIMANALSQERDGWLLLRALLRQINPSTSNPHMATPTTSKMRPLNTPRTLRTTATLVRKTHHHNSKASSCSSLRMRTLPTVPTDMRRLLVRRPTAIRTKLYIILKLNTHGFEGLPILHASR